MNRKDPYTKARKCSDSETVVLSMRLNAIGEIDGWEDLSSLTRPMLGDQLEVYGNVRGRYLYYAAPAHGVNGLNRIYIGSEAMISEVIKWNFKYVSDYEYYLIDLKEKQNMNIEIDVRLVPE